MAPQLEAPSAYCCRLMLLLVHICGLALLLLLLLAAFGHYIVPQVEAAGVLPLILFRHQSKNMDNEPPTGAAGGHLTFSSDILKLERLQYSNNSGEPRRLGRRMMMLLSSDHTSSRRDHHESTMQLMGSEPGSRPPHCHNECDRCQGHTCIATPSFSQGSSRTSQHAVWVCSCLH